MGKGEEKKKKKEVEETKNGKDQMEGKVQSSS